MMGGMYNGFMGGMGGLGLLGIVIGLLFFGGIVLAIAAVAVWLIRRSSGGQTPARGASQTALELLKERYARGELTREEYLNMREDLS